MLATHRLQMRGLKLTVDKESSHTIKSLGQVYQSQLGSIWDYREHAFAKESIADGNSIQACGSHTSTLAA